MIVNNCAGGILFGFPALVNTNFHLTVPVVSTRLIAGRELLMTGGVNVDNHGGVSSGLQPTAWAIQMGLSVFLFGFSFFGV